MVGVGGREEQQHKIQNLPPPLEVVSVALERYREKVASLKRASEEERHALVLVAEALRSKLRLPRDGTFFLHQEWKLPEGSKLDILGVEARTGRLVVIELKASEKSARKVEVEKGGNAWAQASSYAKKLHSHRVQLYPFFQRLGRALAALHQAPTDMLSLRIDPHHLPVACVCWPGGAVLECDDAQRSRVLSER